MAESGVLGLIGVDVFFYMENEGILDPEVDINLFVLPCP